MNNFLLLVFFFGFLFILSPLSSPHAFAQTTASNCIVTKVGNPVGQPSLPAGCNILGIGKWPLETKNPSQYGRVDQGWDLFANKIANILAVVPGVVHMHICTGNCGFGPDFPVLILDTPITVNGHTYKYIYYGHTHTERSVVGKHVNAGDVISHTAGVPIGASAPNQFEIGFLLDFRPPDQPIWDVLHLGTPGHTLDWTPTGQNMCTWLSNLPCSDSGPK